MAKYTIAKEAKEHALRLKNKEMKRNLNKILVATDFIKEIAKELNYDMYDMLEQCLDEVNSLAINLEEEDA